ncbi:hypothetical protein L6R53_02360 [Myxococcota bacterium]|nr:hypothetical protein [Myxococcota bacterium]
MTPIQVQAALSSARTVHGMSVFVAPDGPVALLCAHAASERAALQEALSLLDELGVPTVVVALDDAGRLDAVVELAQALPVPVVSDPYRRLRGRLGLSGSGLLLSCEAGVSARFELDRIRRRTLFSVLFDAAWRDAGDSAAK